MQGSGFTIEYEATELRNQKWAVRPKGQLGTCGWAPRPWTVIYVKARCAEEALHKAEIVRNAP